MRDATFHHVGLIVRELEPALDWWMTLGYLASEIFDDPIQRARIVLLTRPREPMIELVCPNDAESPSFSWIKRVKAGPFHTCFEVPTLEPALASLDDAGFSIVMEPVPAIAFGGRRVCFTWSRASGLLELVEAALAP
ncbi:MAG: VOC family protein [Polyangiales bacterium]